MDNATKKRYAGEFMYEVIDGLISTRTCVSDHPDLIKEVQDMIDQAEKLKSKIKSTLKSE